MGRHHDQNEGESPGDPSPRDIVPLSGHRDKEAQRRKHIPITRGALLDIVTMAIAVHTAAPVTQEDKENDTIIFPCGEGVETMSRVAAVFNRLAAADPGLPRVHATAGEETERRVEELRALGSLPGHLDRTRTTLVFAFPDSKNLTTSLQKLKRACLALKTGVDLAP